MNLELNDKTALVTASTGGIGLAIATRLAAEGAKTIINGRSESSVNNAIERIRESEPKADLLGLVSDNGTADGVARTIDKHPDP